MSVPWLSAKPPRGGSPGAALHGDCAEALVEPMHLCSQGVGVFAFAADQRFQSRPRILGELPLAAGTIVAIGRHAVPALGIFDFLSPQSEVPQGGSLFPGATGTMPVHRRGRVCPFSSMCVMCGAVTWRGR